MNWLLTFLYTCDTMHTSAKAIRRRTYLLEIVGIFLPQVTLSVTTNTLLISYYLVVSQTQSPPSSIDGFTNA